MIEFNGHLTGAAQKRFLKRTVEYKQMQWLILLLLFLPSAPYLVWMIGVPFSSALVTYSRWGLCIVCILGMLFAYIPQSQKAQRARMPRRVFIDNEMIVCVADKYQISRKINDVKKVRDCGEFYELVFSLSKMCEKFICQKDLLTKGSLAEFERIFDGKLVKQ